MEMNFTKTAYRASLLIVWLGLAVNGHSQSFLTNGLVAYYPFNGNANDAVGTNNGTVHGVTLTTDRFGIPNSAYSFNGTSAYIETVNKLPDMQSASASCWISIPVLPGIGGYVFMDSDEDPIHDFWLAIGNNTILFTTKDNMQVHVNLPLLSNTWFQLVSVADNNANVLKIWLNGQLLATSPSFGNNRYDEAHSGCFLSHRAVLAQL
jgi:hypothetical protein